MKPDIIIPYPQQENGFGTLSPERTAYIVVYVRPETNRVLYERAILSGIKGFGEVVYLANLNGALFQRDGILEDHYASQFRFATDPSAEIRRYPEIAARFEEHFLVPIREAQLLGSFEAIGKLAIGEEELFETIVPEADLLDCWGQTFKRISGSFVVNPNLPAIVKLCTPAANVFTVAARFADVSPDIFREVNEAIFHAIVSREETPVIDGERLDMLVWSERVRRTYHISTNHVMAMLDMADFVYTDEEKRLDVSETPLGRWLAATHAATGEKLRALKRSHIVRLRREGRLFLEYLPVCAAGMGLGEIREMLAAG